VSQRGQSLPARVRLELAAITELVPAARSTWMSILIAAFEAGRALGSLSGPRLYRLGLLANGASVLALDLLALAVLIRFVRPAGAAEEGGHS